MPANLPAIDMLARQLEGLKGGVTRPCARARQAKRVLTQGRRGVQGHPGTNRLK